jgi:aspartate/methionine/tyrosine aminotransferase
MLLTASTSEAYGFLFKLLCNPGDEVLVPAPSYPLFDHLARLESVTPVSYPLLVADDFRIDLDALRQRVTDRTRAIVIVSPNNPTGSFIQQSELVALAKLGLPIISDEVFGEFSFTRLADSARTALTVSDTVVFSLFGLSKLVGLPQMKLAWTCINGPDALVSQAMRRLELIADTYLSVATPVQLQVDRLLSLGASVREQIRQRTHENLDALRSSTRSCPSITVLTPEAGWSVVLRLPSTRTEEQWVLGLIGAGVYVHPGHFYDFANEAYVVLSLLPEPVLFVRGVALLSEHVNHAFT